MITDQEAKEIMYQEGRRQALDLQGRAADMTGTEVIAEEGKVPLFVPDKDYSGWDVGSPVAEIVDGEAQVFKWITPVNTAHYPGMRPSTSPALLSPCHTTDPAKAKPYLPPNGTSGLYMTDEVCTKGGHLWRSTKDDNPYPPGEVGTDGYWEDLGEM